MSANNRELIDTFYQHFQDARAALASQIEAAKSSPPSTDALQALALGLAKLRKELTDATAYLPAYDQRQCELQLKALEDGVEGMRAPKAKFAFKRKGAAAPRTATPTPAPAPPSAPATVPAESASGLAFSSKSHAYLTLDSLSTDSDATELAIADLDHCLVNLVPPTRTFSAIHVRNVTNSVLILGNVTGSVLLHDVQRCILVLRCHQFRMHTSKETDVYLSIPSNPIIEHSSRIRFSAYPDSLDLSETQSNSKHLAVQDFSHVRPTPSPNWSALPADKAIKEWPVEVGDTSVDEVVERLLVTLQ